MRRSGEGAIKASVKRGWRKSREFPRVSTDLMLIPNEQEHPRSASSVTSTRKRSRPTSPPPERIVETVVLGNIAFDTWYHSPYPESIVLSPEQNAAASKRRAVFDGDEPNGIGNNAPSPSNASVNSGTCPRLHVCPYCFRYTPILEEYTAHLRHHKSVLKQDPDTPPVPWSAQKVYEYDGYAVWEIDGEIEKLYCQGLSLFGKLFLEQKSVFFDTVGFLYYVLTYTPPVTASKGMKKKGGHKKSISNAEDSVGLRTQVLGFFSKENPSWDHNNLACILIFPPFQHRQLGKLLMSVSYKLSGWEWEGGTIGGPEKPLSSMGRRSYLRFWAERVGRYLLGQSADSDKHRIFHNMKKRKNGLRKEEMTVKEVGERTGMLAEDVVAALGEMGICEVVMPKKKKKSLVNGESNGTVSTPAEEESCVNMIVKVSQVKEWADRNKVGLQDPVREEGFLGEWAMSDDEDGGEMFVDE